MNEREWDQATNNVPWHKSISVKFLAEMTGDMCEAERTDVWGCWHMCIRLPDHTGRHLAVNYGNDYPTAVWR